MILDTKEERFAYRFSQRRSLSIPFDVEKVARSLADVEYKDIPYSVDGLCLDVKGRRGRPKIWLRPNVSERRRNFTIAHEIGHIVIPWHTGSILDELETEESVESSFYIDMEREANRFAAELLMPKAWSSAVIDRAENLQGAMKAIHDIARVSGHAAAVRTLELGPPGWVMSAVRDGLITWSKKTQGTSTRLPVRNEAVQNVLMLTHHEPIRLALGNVTYYWWQERERVEIPACPSRPWREILQEIVSDFPLEHQHRTKQRLNAIIGLALKNHPKGSNPEPMYWSFLKSLENRSDHDPWLHAALAHHLMRDYAVARIYERSER